MSNNPTFKNDYSAKSIKILEGLDAVRKRPAMYIGSTGPQGLHHLAYEIVDNSVDESLAGRCDKIKLILHEDGTCSVEDNGRGIPTDIHPTEKISAAEVVMTKLHAGGKFDKESYKFSGGLHGVGLSVVNALSSKLELEIYKNGKIYTQEYKKGKPSQPLKEGGDTIKTGTYIRFTPDPSIFTETTSFSFDILSARLRELAFLNKGLKISINDEINQKSHEFFFEGGIVSFIEHINAKKEPLFPKVIYFNKEDDRYILEIAIQYNNSYSEQLFSFVNNINTVEGGTHVAGFKSALTKVCNRKAQSLNILKSGESLSSEDVREGLAAVINLKVPEPQFEGQTKTKLGNSEVKGLVDSWTFAALESYFEENPAIIKKILQKAESAKRAREAARKARDLTRRKTVLEGTVLPGKLADCTNENPAETELFIVEGDSAGGTGKQGRDRFTQAILPMKGKILNVEKARLDKMLANEEIKALITAIGGSIGEDFNVEKARYHKIILMTDADVDGAHIRTLLLTFFFRYMKPLIEKGYLYIAQPPLYKVKIGKKEEYLKDERDFNKFIFNWATDQISLSIDNAEDLDQQQWHQLLKNVLKYYETLEKICRNFKLTNKSCNQLVNFLSKHPWTKDQDREILLENLNNYFKEPTLTFVDKKEGDDENAITKTYIKFKLLELDWEVNIDFFDSSDVKKLVTLLEPIKYLEESEWTLNVKNREKYSKSKGILSFVHEIVILSKPYMNIQRYKGLGEMNPEQLWETAMDPKTRNLLQVEIEDTLEADAWFTTLMGEIVAGRKKYIEENGRFVKNLDV